jgi:hypothetical protein
VVTQVAEEALTGPVDRDLLAPDEVRHDHHDHVQAHGHVHGLMWNGGGVRPWSMA